MVSFVKIRLLKITATHKMPDICCSVFFVKSELFPRFTV